MILTLNINNLYLFIHYLYYIILNNYFYINNQIGDKGCKAIANALKTNTSIKKINLKVIYMSCVSFDLNNQLNHHFIIFIGNEIGAEGFRAIADSLKTNTSIIELNLLFI